MRAVIVEDHFNALQDLLYLIEDICPEIEVVGSAGNEPEALRLIREKKPDLVFLDIELVDGGNGFAILDALQMPQLQVVFVSGHGEFAPRAFRADNTVDFLLKPVQEPELRQAFERALEERTLRENDAQYRLWRDAIVNNRRPRIALADQQRIIFPYLDSIVYIDADAVTSTFYFDTPAPKMTVTKNLRHFEKLDEAFPELFMRVHRSSIINLTKVVGYERPDRKAVMDNGARIKVAANNLDEFLKRLATSNS
jgi:two-component system, LytTR family, response regulator